MGTDDDPTVVRANPQVFVRDVATSAAWFRDVLGFEIDYLYGEPPSYAGLHRGGAHLNLRHTDRSPWADDDERDREALLSASIVVTDAEAIFLEVQARGVDLQQTLTPQPWGSTDFVVRDPDGNLVLFGS